jgi:DNA-binding response OmpR family regulator
MEVLMPLTVVLAVGLDSSLPTTQNAVWRSAGYVVTPAGSIGEAIDRFKNGDFDLVLLGQSIPAADREKLTFLIRTSGSHVPVICIGNACGDCDSYADATLKNDLGELPVALGEVLARKSRTRAAPAILYGNAG